MGCGNSKEDQTMGDEENKRNAKKGKKMKNEKIKITEDPEKQGEKFHLNEKNDDDDDEEEEEKEGEGEGEGNDDKGEKDSFDDY